MYKLELESWDYWQSLPEGVDPPSYLSLSLKVAIAGTDDFEYYNVDFLVNGYRVPDRYLKHPNNVLVINEPMLTHDIIENLRVAIAGVSALSIVEVFQKMDTILDGEEQARRKLKFLNRVAGKAIE